MPVSSKRDNSNLPATDYRNDLMLGKLTANPNDLKLATRLQRTNT